MLARRPAARERRARAGSPAAAAARRLTAKSISNFGVGKAKLKRPRKAAPVTAVVAAMAALAPAPVTLPDYSEVALRAVDDGANQLEAEKAAHQRCRGQLYVREKAWRKSTDLVRRMLTALVARALPSARERLGVDEACELSGLEFSDLHGRLVVSDHSGHGKIGVCYVDRPTERADALRYPRGYFARG